MDIAFDALWTRYGDEERVLGLRVAEMKKLGSLPERYKGQVTFYVDLEGKIQEILNLGAKGDHLGRLAYGQDVFNAVYNLLKHNLILKLLAVPGSKYSREKLENTKKKLGEFRADANALDMIVPDAVKKQNHGGGSGTGSGSGSGSGGRSHVQSAASLRTVADCKVCKFAEEYTGNHSKFKFFDKNKLFKNHWGPGLYQCPTFMGVTQAGRVQLCYDVSA